MGTKRRAIIAGLALLLALSVSAAVWQLLGLPPVPLVLIYGFPPAGGPTGETHTDPVGARYVEIGPGYFLRGSHRHCEEGDVLGRLASLVGLDFGKAPDHRREEGPVGWVEVPNAFSLGTTETTNWTQTVFA